MKQNPAATRDWPALSLGGGRHAETGNCAGLHLQQASSVWLFTSQTFGEAVPR